jgi:hypothetical protein
MRRQLRPAGLALLLSILAAGAARAQDAAQLVGHTLPAAMTCGEVRSVSVTLLNSGSTTWLRYGPQGGYKLGAIDDSDPFRSDWRVWLPTGVTVAPGQVYTFNFTLTAPQQEGVYLSDWRMVHEGVAWFGPIAQRSISVGCGGEVDAAQVVSHTLPASMLCGQTATASVTLRNVGTTTWSRYGSLGGYKLGAVGESDPFHPGRVWLPVGVEVAPNQTYTFTLDLTAPQVAGDYPTDWQMVHEGVAWFGGIAARTVAVSCPSAVDAAQLVSHTLPATMQCGETRQATVTMRNSGTTTWSRYGTQGGYKLGAVGDADPFHPGRVWLPAGVEVAPNQTYTFTLDLTAPQQAGSYLTDWRMVHEGVAWFGAIAARNVAVACPVAVDASQVVSHTLPATMQCGETRSVAVTMKNTGTTTWSRYGTQGGYKLGAVDDTDPFHPGRVWLPVGVEVAPNQTYTFAFDLTAPQQAGSYLTDWRMVHEGVAWFGATAARTVAVACPVPVDAAQVESHTLPATMQCGETRQAAVTMKNTGTTTWSRYGTQGGYKLGAVGDSDPFHPGRVWLPVGVEVAPNQTYTFTFDLTAPQQAGSYLTDWRMVHEGVGWFGATAARTVAVACPEVDAAQLVAHTLPAALECGESRSVTVTMKNTGTSTWRRYGALGGYKLGAVGDSDPFRADHRVWLPSGVTVAPNQTYTFAFDLTAPQTAGTYLTDWRMVHEGIGWFGPTAARSVAVTCQAPDLDASEVVSHTLPATLECGEVAPVTVTMRNTGDTTWTRYGALGGYKLGAVGDSDPFHPGRVWLPSGVAVAPNQTYTFAFDLTAPQQGGTYTTDWRMVHEGVGWFGPTVARSVVVSCPGGGTDGAAVVSHTLPTAMECGESRAVSVTMKNTGTSTWSRYGASGGYKLGAVDDSDPFTGNHRVWLPEGVEVAPNGTYTFALTLTAPPSSGTFLTDWRMVHEGVGWFGATAARNVVVACGGGDVDDAQVSDAALPSALACGQSFAASVTLLNIGQTAWTAAAGYRLVPVAAPDPVGGPAFVPLPPGASIPPLANHTFDFTLTAPPSPGTPLTRWQMSRPGAGNFGEVALQTVQVSCGPVPDPPAIGSISPAKIPLGQVSTVILTGTDFAGATATVPDPGIPGLVSPQVVSATVSAGGTRLDVVVDATHPDSAGLFAVAVETAGGADAIEFRVVPNRPYVDMWTPEEAESGATYMLLVVGSNLQGATLTSSHPGVDLLGLDTASDTAITGLLRVSDGASGTATLTLARPGGGSTSLTVQLVAAGGATRTAVNVAEGREPFGEGRAPLPPVWLQEFALEGQLARAAEAAATGVTPAAPLFDPEVQQAGICPFPFYLRGTLLNFAETFSLPIDLFGDIDPQVLEALRFDQATRFGALTISAFANVHAELTIDLCTFSLMNLCVFGVEGLEVPGIQSIVHSFSYCLFGGFSQFLFASGVVNSYSFSSPGQCVGLTQVTGPAAGGEQYADAVLVDCCSETVSVSGSGVSFQGTAFEWGWSGDDLPFVTASPAPEVCQVPEPRLALFLDAGLDNTYDPGNPQPLVELTDIESYVPCADPGTGTSVASLPQEMLLVAAYVLDSGPGAVTIVEPPAGISSATFSLEDTSAFEGVASNFGAETTPDFSLDGGAASVTATFDSTTKTAAVAFRCHDYGGFTKAKVTTGFTSPADEVTVRIPEVGSDGLLPKRGWHAFDGTLIVNPGFIAGQDIDAVPGVSGPPATGLTGDGFSNYEEYRGFLVRGQHRRTSPHRKDLFLSSNLATSIAFAFPNLPTATHRVWGQDEPGNPLEYGTAREMNHKFANHGFGGPVAGHLTQRAVRGVGVAIAPTTGLFGQAFGVTLPGGGNPNVATHLDVYLNTHAALGMPPTSYTATQIANETRRTFGHEVGHTVNMCHRPGGAACAALAGTGLSIMSSALAGGPGAGNPASQYDANDRAQLRLHTNF